MSKLPKSEPAYAVIELDNDQYCLTSDVVRSHTELSVQRKRAWRYPTIKLVSLEDGLITFTNTNDKETFDLVIKIEPGRLNCFCSCKEFDGRICQHIFKVLSDITLFQSRTFFPQYAPGGIAELAMANPNCFTIDEARLGPKFIPKKELGNIYRISSDHHPEGFQKALTDILNSPVTRRCGTSNKREIAQTYIVTRFNKYNLPGFLLPSIALLNKAGTIPKGFDKFLTGFQDRYNDYLNDTQRQLNTVCQQMWLGIKPSIESQRESNFDLGHFHNLWLQVWPLLLQQEFVYYYKLYQLKAIRTKPFKARMERMYPGDKMPQVQFRLSDYKTYHQLQMEILLDGKVIKDADVSLPFFITVDNQLFFLDSYRDAMLVNWMHQKGGRITVFTEHFEAFKAEVLYPIKSSYKASEHRNTTRK